MKMKVSDLSAAWRRLARCIPERGKPGCDRGKKGRSAALAVSLRRARARRRPHSATAAHKAYKRSGARSGCAKATAEGARRQKSAANRPFFFPRIFFC